MYLGFSPSTLRYHFPLPRPHWWLLQCQQGVAGLSLKWVTPWVIPGCWEGTQHLGRSRHSHWGWMQGLLPLQPEAVHPCEEHSCL